MEFLFFSTLLMALLFIIIWVSKLKNDINILSKRIKYLYKKMDALNDDSTVNKTNEIIRNEYNPESVTDIIPANSTFETPSETNTRIEEANQDFYEQTSFPPKNTINDIIEQDIGDFNNEIKSTYIEHQKSSMNFEKIFMGNIFNKIGAVAILISVCIFVKIISQYIIFTNEMKMILSFIAGFFMIFGAFKIQKDKKMQIFSEVLMGTGFGTILITTYCGAGFLKIFSPPFALIIACIIMLAIYFIADKQKTTSMIVLGLIGGYLNPFFVNHNITMNFLFNYFIFLNIISLVFVYRNQNKEVINIVNLSLTSLSILIFSCLSENFSIAQMLILWGAYVLYDLLTIKDKLPKLTSGLSYLNFAVLTILTLILFKDYKVFGLFIMGYCIIYCVLGLYYNKKLGIKENSYIFSSLIALFIATIFLTMNNSNLISILCLCIEAAIISAIAATYSTKKIFYFSSVFFTYAVLKLFISSETYENYFYPIFNLRELYFLPVIISGTAISLITQKVKQLYDSDIYKLISICLIYIYLLFELNSIYSELGFNNILFEYIGITILFIFAFNLKYLVSNLTLKTLFSNISDCIFTIGLVLLFLKDTGIFFTNTHSDIMPILNMRSIAYFFSGLTLYYNYKVNKTNWQKYLAVILGFLYIHFETINTISAIDNYNLEWLISVMWILYAGIISIIGIFSNKKFLKISGIWLSLLAVGRIFIYDLANLDMIYKLIAFIALGIALMIISYFYNKKVK